MTLLPGAALTLATIELATGSMISGSARLVYGLERLLLLTFGIRSGSLIYFEIALVLGALSFVSTLALAKFLMRGEVIE